MSSIIAGKYFLQDMYPYKVETDRVSLNLQTASLSIGVGTACTAAAPQIILEALVITAAIVVGLTAYAFHASRKGVEFSFMGPILISSRAFCLPSYFDVSCSFFPLSRLVSKIQPSPPSRLLWRLHDMHR